MTEKTKNYCIACGDVITGQSIYCPECQALMDYYDLLDEEKAMRDALEQEYEAERQRLYHQRIQRQRTETINRLLMYGCEEMAAQCER